MCFGAMTHKYTNLHSGRILILKIIQKKYILYSNIIIWTGIVCVRDVYKTPYYNL